MMNKSFLLSRCLRTTKYVNPPRAISNLSHALRSKHGLKHEDPNEKVNSSSDSERENYYFGFEKVAEEEKSKKVKTVFENVAETYDLMNDTMSVGIHRLWKDIFVHKLGGGDKSKIIDVAGGTGDIAFRILKYTKVKPYNSKVSGNPSFKNIEHVNENKEQINDISSNPGQSSNRILNEKNAGRSVLVCDINSKMLEVGKRRSKTILTPDQLNRIDWLEGDAENLHTIPDSSFDAYTIAFGIRNVTHIDKVLEEAYRILRPGGRFLCLEFSHVTNPALKWVYDQYSFQLIPVMGQVLAGDWDSYQYLVESIRKFPTQDEFQNMIEDAGFRFVSYENLTFGIAAIHQGFKI